MIGDAARAAVAAVARAMGPDLAQVVFVGGMVPALYRLAPSVGLRPTDDVDVIANVLLSDYYALVERLRRRGFEACADEHAPICRYVYDGHRVDLMPTEATPIGPTNRWYPEAFVRAARYEVALGLSVRAVTPVYFVATKLVAFHGRGEKMYADSEDLEDVLAVLSGVEALRDEVDAGATDVAGWVRAELTELAGIDGFRDALRGHFVGDEEGTERAAKMVGWLRALRAVRGA